MAKPKIDCEACEDLKEYIPELVQNGVTDKICNSLKNDTGFKTNSRHTDCQDLDTANDCMIGQMDDRLEAYDACGWREFMHRIIPNIHAMYKMIICAICGLWTNIHALWDRIEIIEAAIEALKRRVKALEDAIADFVADLDSIRASIRTLSGNITTINNNITDIRGDISDIEDDIVTTNRRIDEIDTGTERIDCIIDFLTQGTSGFHFDEDTSGDAYVVAGKGVSFLIPHGGEPGVSDVYLHYIAGGLMRGGGAYRFFENDFTDEKSCANFDNGTNIRTSTSRKGNIEWGGDKQSRPLPRRPVIGGELIAELRMKNSAFPQIARLYPGFGQESGGGGYHVQVTVHSAGSYAPGQHGGCDAETGQGRGAGYDDGHLVPNGWTYVQLRMTYLFSMDASDASGAQYSPTYFMGCRVNGNAIEC